jgi:hypothetical protein
MQKADRKQGRDLDSIQERRQTSSQRPRQTRRLTGRYAIEAARERQTGKGRAFRGRQAGGRHMERQVRSYSFHDSEEQPNRRNFWLAAARKG